MYEMKCIRLISYGYTFSMIRCINSASKSSNKYFFDKPKHFFYIMFFHYIFMNVVNITNIKSPIINRKIVQAPIYPCYLLQNFQKYFLNTMNVFLF